jgi:hypothetical protein
MFGEIRKVSIFSRILKSYFFQYQLAQMNLQNILMYPQKQAKTFQIYRVFNFKK